METKPLKQEGTFRAVPLTWGLTEKGGDSRSVGVGIEFLVDYKWNAETEQWEDWRAGNFAITGYFYVVGKEGNLNDMAINQLRKSLGWDSGLEELVAETAPWNDRPVNITCAFEEYNGKSSLKVKWLNPPDDSPARAIGNVAPERVSELAMLFNPKIRATGSGEVVLPITALPKRGEAVLAEQPVDAIPY
jgi:hypothetical protein